MLFRSADKDKVSRAIPAGALAANGRLYIPSRAEWGEKWVQEHVVFPNGTHDDMVDTTAYAAICLHQYHDIWIPRDEDGRTLLPNGIDAGRTIEERYQHHLRSRTRGSKRAAAARNRL